MNAPGAIRNTRAMGATVRLVGSYRHLASVLAGLPNDLVAPPVLPPPSSSERTRTVRVAHPQPRVSAVRRIAGWLMAAALAVSCVVSSCGAPDRKAEADQLKQAIKEMPGVQDASVGYPTIFEQGATVNIYVYLPDAPPRANLGRRGTYQRGARRRLQSVRPDRGLRGDTQPDRKSRAWRRARLGQHRCRRRKPSPVISCRQRCPR